MSDRPSVDVTLMATAHLWAERSTCSRGRVGAVIADNGRSVVTGYNGAPAGMPHCNHDLAYMPKIQQPTEWMRKAAPVPSVVTERGCMIATHAEANAIAYAARHGIPLVRTTLYVTMSPCAACAKLIIAAGLSRVVYDRKYRNDDGLVLLKAAGILVECIA